MKTDKFIYTLLLLGTMLILFEMKYIDLAVAKWGFSHEFDNIQYSAKLLSHGADATYWLIGSALLYLFFYFVQKSNYLASRAKFFFLSVAVSGIAVNIIKVIFGRPRPYMFKNEGIFDFQFLQTNYNYFSFPSGHTTSAFAIAMALTLMFPRYAAVFFAYALLMAYARVACYMHYVSDVTAGAMLGVITALLLYNYKKTTFIKKDSHYE